MPHLFQPLSSTFTPRVRDFRDGCPGLVNAISNKVKNYTYVLLTSGFWFVFFFQRRLGDAAKKAISKLQVRTIKKGDKVTADSFLFGEGPVKKVPDFSGSQGRKEGRMGKGVSNENSSPVSVIIPIFIRYNLKQFIKCIQQDNKVVGKKV